MSNRFNSNNKMDIRCGELAVVRINKNYWENMWLEAYEDREVDENGLIIGIDYKNDSTEEAIWDIINDRVVFLYEKNMTRDDRNFEILYVIDEELEKASQNEKLVFLYDDNASSSSEDDEEDE